MDGGPGKEARGRRHSSGRTQRPKGLGNSKAIRFQSQEMLWGLEGVAQWDSTCLACIRPKVLSEV